MNSSSLKDKYFLVQKTTNEHCLITGLQASEASESDWGYWDKNGNYTMIKIKVFYILYTYLCKCIHDLHINVT